ncbi:MAG: Flp pilus assembly protein CpaB [Thermaerobacterales bacterium]
MSKGKILRFFLIPTLVGLIVTSLVYVYLAPDQNPGIEAEDLMPVVRAAGPIPAKTALTREMVTVEQMPRRFVGRHTVTSLDDVLGEISLVPLAEGEVLLSTRLAGAAAPAGLAYRVPEGLRAVSIRVNEIIGVGGFIQPGDHVDVIATLPPDAAEDEGDVSREQQSMMLLEKVAVLAVTRDIEVQQTDRGREAGDYRYLTVAVTPADAVTLTLAEELGSLRLLLRPATAGDGELAGRLVRTRTELGR